MNPLRIFTSSLKYAGKVVTSSFFPPRVGSMGPRRILTTSSTPTTHKLQIASNNCFNTAKSELKKPTGYRNIKTALALTGAGVVGYSLARAEQKEPSPQHYYEPKPLQREELKPVVQVAVKSKLAEGVESEATIYQNYYNHHPKDVGVLIAGGTGDIAFHSILYFLRMGVEVTFTSRKEDPWNELQDLMEQLTEEEKELLHCEMTPSDEEGWFKLMKKVGEGKKDVHINHLIGVPVHQGNEQNYTRALGMSESLAKAAAHLESEEKEKSEGKRVQFSLASSVTIDLIPDHDYAKFKAREEERILKLGPSNTTVVRIPLAENPTAPSRKATAFGLKEMAYMPLQVVTGSQSVPLPITSTDDIGKAFGVKVDGKFVVSAVSKQTQQGDLIEAMTKSYGEKVREIVLNTKIIHEIANTINIGHATDYSVNLIENQMTHPIDVSDSNFEKLLGRPATDVVKLYTDIAEEGKVLPPPALRAHLLWLKEQYQHDPDMLNKFKETLKTYGPEITMIAFDAFYKDPTAIKDVFIFAKELYKAAKEENILPTSFIDYIAQIVYSHQPTSLKKPSDPNPIGSPF